MTEPHSAEFTPGFTDTGEPVVVVSNDDYFIDAESLELSDNVFTWLHGLHPLEILLSAMSLCGTAVIVLSVLFGVVA